jgi:hypothetical protein
MKLMQCDFVRGRTDARMYLNVFLGFLAYMKYMLACSYANLSTDKCRIPGANIVDYIPLDKKEQRNKRRDDDVFALQKNAATWNEKVKPGYSAVDHRLDSF